MSIFWAFALAGVGLLLVAAAYLVWMNWSGDEMWPRIISALGIGAITLVVAVLTGLKPSREEIKFASVVIIDDATRRPPILRPDPDRAFDPAYQRIMDLTSLTLELNETPQSPDQISSYCAELLQYKLLSDLRDIQRAGTGVGVALGAPRLQVMPSNAIVKLPDQVELPPSDFAGYDSNRFSKTQTAAFRWEIMGGLRLPQHTKVQLQTLSGPERHIIRLVRQGYFAFEIAVEPVAGGATQPPDGTHYLDDKKHTLTAYVCDVTMTAEFEKLTAGNWRTQYYKRWITWLMSEIAKRNRES